MLALAAKNDKKQIVLGLEPTGHYWFALAAWMVSNGISVVQVNPYAVKQSKEIEDNSQLKDDRKDPKLIANLVKDGNYGMPYLPEKVYADMRRLSMFRDQLTEDRIRNINRLHRELKIYFPEYMDAFGKIDAAFTLEVLKGTAIPSEIKARGAYVVAVAQKKGAKVGKIADQVIWIDDIFDDAAVIPAVIVLQLLAYYTSVHKGCDVDKPRNLAKSVTVE